MVNILGRAGSISKWRGGADDFLRLLPVLPSVSLWLCQWTLWFKWYFVHIWYDTFPSLIVFAQMPSTQTLPHSLVPFVGLAGLHLVHKTQTHSMSTFAEQREHIISTIKSPWCPWKFGTQKSHWTPAWKEKKRAALLSSTAVSSYLALQELCRSVFRISFHLAKSSFHCPVSAALPSWIHRCSPEGMLCLGRGVCPNTLRWSEDTPILRRDSKFSLKGLTNHTWALPGRHGCPRPAST